MFERCFFTYSMVLGSSLLFGVSIFSSMGTLSYFALNASLILWKYISIKVYIGSFLTISLSWLSMAAMTHCFLEMKVFPVLLIS